MAEDNSTLSKVDVDAMMTDTNKKPRRPVSDPASVLEDLGQIGMGLGGNRIRFVREAEGVIPSVGPKVSKTEQVGTRLSEACTSSQSRVKRLSELATRLAHTTAGMKELIQEASELMTELETLVPVIREEIGEKDIPES